MFVHWRALQGILDMGTPKQHYAGGLRKAKGFPRLPTLGSGLPRWKVTKLNVYISELAHVVKGLASGYRKFLQKSSPAYTTKMFETFCKRFFQFVETLIEELVRNGSKLANFR